MKKIILTTNTAKRINQFKGVILFSSEGEKTIPFEIKLQTSKKVDRHISYMELTNLEGLSSLPN